MVCNLPLKLYRCKAALFSFTNPLRPISNVLIIQHCFISRPSDFTFKVWWQLLLFLFILSSSHIHNRIHTIHSFITILLFSSLHGLLREKNLPAEPGFELAPALQQPSALPTQPRRGILFSLSQMLRSKLIFLSKTPSWKLTKTNESETVPGVDDLRSVVLHGRHAPDHEEALGEPVEGNPPNQDI